MPVRCLSGMKPRFRFRRTKKKGIKQRIAFCDGVSEVVTFKDKKKIVRRL